MIRPLVEDAVELQDLGQAVYNEIDRISWQQSVDEAVSLYVATLRMPTNLFERLSERLEEVERKLSKSQIAKRRQSDPVSAWRTISSSFR
ncbi:hypothetical protein [Roseibium aggregatum]|uniref:Uncharacterized protein n=1 Tax=Roseibium aggregatum TaxID=187304 RepID=A0A939J3S7_9HYPH|nr:hypothetical protein [Roseibium aggregatum]MBN9669974.1 hypothetical protein [Roseibium aggregatum]